MQVGCKWRFPEPAPRDLLLQSTLDIFLSLYIYCLIIIIFSKHIIIIIRTPIFAIPKGLLLLFVLLCTFSMAIKMNDETIRGVRLGMTPNDGFFSFSLLLDSRKKCGCAFLVIACPVKKTIITLLAQFVGVARSRFLECTRRPNSTGMHASSP